MLAWDEEFRGWTGFLGWSEAWDVGGSLEIGDGTPAKNAWFSFFPCTLDASNLFGVFEAGRSSEGPKLPVNALLKPEPHVSRSHPRA